MEKTPEIVIEEIINMILIKRQNATLYVEDAPDIPSDYTTYLPVSDGYYQSINPSKWYTGDTQASLNTYYVLEQSNKLKSTGFYKPVSASEGGLEIFSYYKIMHKFSRFILSDLGVFTADCRRSGAYSTHNWHGKRMDFEELAVMYMAFEKFGCKCTFTEK